jgi:hypothetical protein
VFVTDKGQCGRKGVTAVNELGMSFSEWAIGRMGKVALRILIKPLIFGAEGFKFTYFHFPSVCIVWEHSLLLFMNSF